jgi:tetratricopeptide (TPR) repeat protein
MRQVLDDRSTISLSMIVRNEERFIGQCLGSVKDFVDEMIVVDTGSTDRTAEIARQFGAAVFQHTWTGDFSEARNHSISRAASDWILILDADEKLAERDARRLRELVRHTRADGFKLIQRTYLQDANFVCASANPKDYVEGREYSDCVNVDVIRFFRNDPEIRYAGRVHELVEPVFLSRRLSYETTSVVIHHFGKVGDPAHLERKKLLYLDLGRQKVVDEPENALAHFELGVQFYELGQYSNCVGPFKEALRLNPAFDLALLYVAKALHMMGDMDAAAGYFRACLKQFPSNDRVLFDYANFVRDRGNARTALKLYLKAVVANPTHALALFNMGILCFQIGDPDRAIGFIERAVRLNPENRTFHENLARLPLPKTAIPKVARLLERYVEKFPGAVDCLAALAEMHFKIGQFEKAAHCADQTLALDPDRTGALLTRAHARMGLGCLAEAEESYRSALRLDANNLDSMMNLAAIAEARGDKAQARSWYLRTLDTHPGQPQVIKRFAATQTTAGVDPEAAAALERACPSELQDPQCLLLVGSLLERAGKVRSATKLYESAAHQKPEWGEMIHRKLEQLGLSSHNGGTLNVSSNP